MREFTEEEVERYNKLLDQAGTLIEGQIWMSGVSFRGTPNWFVSRKLRKALDLYKQALEINPESMSSWFWVGKIYQRFEQPEQALDAFSRAYQINPQQSLAAHEAGLSALDLGKVEEALYFCRIAVEANPDDPGHVANMAWAHVIAGDTATAQEIIQKAGAAAPELEILGSIQEIIEEIASGARPRPTCLREIRHG